MTDENHFFFTTFYVSKFQLSYSIVNICSENAYARVGHFISPIPSSSTGEAALAGGKTCETKLPSSAKQVFEQNI